MGEFFLNQRYTSSGEPELGVGIVTEISKGKVRISFPVADDIRLYSIESAPLLRTIFKPGHTIVDQKGQSMVIEGLEYEEGLYTYYGDDRELREDGLGDVSSSHTVDDRLFAGDVDTPELFALRRETLDHDYQRRISPVHGFVGGKVDLIPHQLYIAHEVSSRFAPRVLLSDQVGLGKTIEACLILHRLLVTGRISRVLILVPESLVHQWFVEVLRRFNLWFNIFDEERCKSLEKGAPEGNPFLDDQLVICSIDFLAGSRKRTQQAISANWDMLVVDEAHHLEWSVEEASPEYSIVELLSQVAKGLLLLTATPEQLGVESHFARLRLLDPNRYTNYNDFINESEGNKDIAAIIEKLSQGKVLKPKETTLLESIFSKERIALLANKDEITTHNLIEDLLDQHGPGRVLFRNTRQAMSGFPKRIPHLIPLQDQDNQSLWVERLRNEFFYDMEGTSESGQDQAFWFDEDPRFLWLVGKMEELQEAKILLICTSKEKVLALASALESYPEFTASVFHEDLTLVQRDRNAAYFSEPDGAQLLICSEIGSEGRNFQFAHHLVLFDMPFHPELLEQRIGRLDRIGQKRDITIYNPYLIGSPQELLVRWFHEGLNAFNTNLEGGNIISKLFSNRLLTISKLSDYKEAESELKSLIRETADYQKVLKKNLAEGRDSMLEMNSFRPKVAEKLIQQIQAEDTSPVLETYLTKVFMHFDIEMEDLAARTYLLHPASFSASVFPSIPKEGVQITFDRQRALSREDVSFVTWDHPMATGAIDKVLSSSMGTASCGLIRGTSNPGLLLELIFVLETAGKQSIDIDRFLPHMPLRIVVDHMGKKVTASYTVAMFNKSVIPGKIDPLLDNEAFVEILLPKMISSATQMAEEMGNLEIAKGLERMNGTLDHEINRLTALQKKNKDIRIDEIQTAIEERDTLSSLIKKARVRLDSVQLIRKE
ncbi:ATP-dependent helicase HepA [Algoriphagus ratkowskyi]|uniref:ATP-dependent helicase HepA n=1 Tax=Algoriphagus ratkowskyi TaxID=57028 RepID=A0A2W7R9Y0_9BACT|nr:RNA polymerase-associated protein RapA [Algoriphagus ratkowskyi]PZX55946.1 ATP-dependent helicase HepA [Algoriphagus ratkowskyi]TXD77241.1 RNA polymerase-associated protein RapA [Algoriphagus ratkowskyi]